MVGSFESCIPSASLLGPVVLETHVKASHKTSKLQDFGPLFQFVLRLLFHFAEVSLQISAQPQPQQAVAAWRSAKSVQLASIALRVWLVAFRGLQGIALVATTGEIDRFASSPEAQSCWSSAVHLETEFDGLISWSQFHPSSFHPPPFAQDIHMRTG